MRARGKKKRNMKTFRPNVRRITFWFAFLHLLLSISRNFSWVVRSSSSVLQSSITKDDHFSAWSWNCTSNRTWDEISRNVFFSRSIFYFNNDVVIKSALDTLQVILLCHSPHTYCDMWFVCDKVQLAAWAFFFSSERSLKNLNEKKVLCAKNVTRHFFALSPAYLWQTLLEHNKLLSTIVIRRKHRFLITEAEISNIGSEAET